MLLHPHVRAHCRVTVHNPQRRHQLQTCPQLSVTLGALPETDALICHEILPGHWLAIAREGATYDEVALAYVTDPRIPAWIAERIYAIYGMPNPLISPRGYFERRWWEDDWMVTTASVSLLEGIGGDLITPWPHAWLH